MSRASPTRVDPGRRASAPGLARLRLHAQGIAAPLREPHEVVERLGAVQAQDYLGALWAVGLRLEQAGEADVERALARGTILRTWPMRGTLHFVPARDARWMLRLMTPRIVARGERRYRELGLDAATFARAGELLAGALEGGRRLTRPAALALLEAAGISTGGQRGIHVLQRLAMDALLCFGPREGKQQTFVLLEEWAPRSIALEREEALAEIAVRYFTGHGPAAAPDLAWWTGLPAADVREAIALAAPRLEHERIDGETYWWSGRTGRPAGGGAARAWLLPGFDELVVGYSDRSALFDPAHRGKVRIGANGMLSPTIVLGGRLIGTWKRTLGRRGVAIEPALFGRLDEAGRRALSAASARYGAFLGLPVAAAPSSSPSRGRTRAVNARRARAPAGLRRGAGTRP